MKAVALKKFNLNRDQCIKHYIQMFTVIKLVTFRKGARRIFQQIHVPREGLFKLPVYVNTLIYWIFCIILPEKTKTIAF